MKINLVELTTHHQTISGFGFNMLSVFAAHKIDFILDNFHGSGVNSRSCAFLKSIKAKPQPAGKRFQRQHVDSMWQGDTFQFRIRGFGKVYVTGFTDDCSRYRVRGKVYLHKDAASAVNALQWALRIGRIPREIYVDNGKQFVAKTFKAEAQKHGIKLIFGRPYNPRRRGKIERYHKALYQELICLKEFRSLSHFKRELWNFDQQYNYWRKQEILDWMTPASVYHNEINFNKNRKI